MGFGHSNLFPLISWQSISYFVITLGIEVFPSFKLTLFMIKKWCGNITPRHTPSYLENLLEPSLETDGMNFDEDIDVKTEKNRVLSGSLDNAIIYLRNLRKVFPNMIWVCLLYLQSCFISDNGIIYSGTIVIIFLISDLLRRAASPEKGCSRFTNLRGSGRRMLWLFRDKWSWEDYNFVHVVRYIRSLSKI